MYTEYKNSNNIPISRTIYEKLVYDLNIFIKSPKTDTCNTCDKLNMQISLAVNKENGKLQEILNEHHRFIIP